jgi:hypothetical protein
MRYLILLLPLLCISACDTSRDTTCAPSFTPGTPAYANCRLRNGQDPTLTNNSAAGLHPQFLRSQ